MNSKGDPDRITAILVCPVCSAVESYCESDLVKYSQSGWPTCCGETMSLFALTEKPKVPKTETDKATPTDGTKTD
jgi:hypothetical protein